MITRLALCFLVLQWPGKDLWAGSGSVRLVTPRNNLSLRLEIQHRLDRGFDWLLEQQDEPSGSWGKEGSVALTSLVVTVLKGDPEGSPEARRKEMERAYAFLLGTLRERGKPESAEPVTVEEWARVVPALSYHEDRKAIEPLMQLGLHQLQQEMTLPWEVEFLVREARHSARITGFLGADEGSGAIKPLDSTRVSARRSYQEWIVKSYEESLSEAEATRRREWLQERFFQDLESGDVALLLPLSKVIAASGVETLVTDAGKTKKVGEELALRLFDLQQRNGSWRGEIPAADPDDVVVRMTCQAMLALEILIRAL